MNQSDQRSLLRRMLLLTLSTAAVAPAVARQPAVTWVSSNDEQAWQTMAPPEMTAGTAGKIPDVSVAAGRTYQTIEGFGGCFNELGWAALAKVSPAERDRAINALFGTDGCAFNLARIPIGASDYALDGYSCADAKDDFALEHFSIDRDRRHLLPFIKAALAVRPQLRAWASPWSPPAWMKTNNSYSRGMLRWEPRVLSTYATYFTKWVEAYRAEGVAIYAVSPQNEPNILNVYPTCEWTGDQLREFIGDYLGPTLAEYDTKLELYLGLNGDPSKDGENPNARLRTVLDDPKANAFLTGIALQYDSRTQIAVAKELYPDKKLMQSETECNGGANSWADAQKLYGLMRRYLSNNAGSYFAWNMVLAPDGMSTWNWKQNALITADPATQTITLNGEYHVMRHFSGFIKPGAKRVASTGLWGDQIAFVNPDGSTVLVIGNSLNKPTPITIRVPGKTDADTITATLAARSINTFVVPAP